MRFSIEAEQSVIGGLLLDPNRLDDVLEICTADDFYNIDNRAIFAAICDMGATGKTVDVITLSEKLNDSGELERVGGLGYLVEIANNTPSAANVKAYASILADRAMERRITEAGQRIAELGDDESIPVDDKLDTLHGELSGLERRDGAEVINFNVILKARIKEIDEKFHDKKPRGLMTGFNALDERYQGISQVAMWVLAARPGQGKTAFALNVALNQARQGKEVLIFSLEMGKDELTDRLLSASGGLPSGRIRTGKLLEDDWHKLSTATTILKDLKIHIVDIPAIDINRAKAIARKFNRYNKLGLVVIDYLQLMTNSKAKNRFEEVSSVSREIKAMAKTLGCPVMALSQLNRGVEKQGNKRPSMSDLRESGQIEQDADIITFIYRDEYYNENTPNKGMAEFITSKFREGEVGTDVLGAELQFARFINFDSSSYIFDWQDSKEQQSYGRQKKGFD
jgi:replicative DNA helicase